MPPHIIDITKDNLTAVYPEGNELHLLYHDGFHTILTFTSTRAANIAYANNLWLYSNRQLDDKVARLWNVMMVERIFEK